jgi:hypothetical protein
VAWSTNARRNRKDAQWRIVDPKDLGLLVPATPAGPLTYDRSKAPGVDDVRQAVDAKRQA